MHPSILIDEIDEKELEQELAARIKARASGKCDYCGRHPLTRSCKFPERHHDGRIIYTQPCGNCGLDGPLGYVNGAPCSQCRGTGFLRT
jgi:hypothetical protein